MEPPTRRKAFDALDRLENQRFVTLLLWDFLSQCHGEIEITQTGTMGLMFLADLLAKDQEEVRTVLGEVFALVEKELPNEAREV